MQGGIVAEICLGLVIIEGSSSCDAVSGCLVALGEGVNPAALVGVLDARAGILPVCLIEALLTSFRVLVAQALRQCFPAGFRADVLHLFVAEGCSLVVLHLRRSFRVVALDGVQLPADVPDFG